MTFKDHFSGHAAEYAAARPNYPDNLFAYLASLCANRDLAWDCATGNGQAALSLAAHFTNVLATDASSGQVQAAVPHPRIEYRVARAESPGIQSDTVDLISVAQALHWFAIPEFFAECERILKPGGLLAVWSYGQCTVTPEVDAIVTALYAETLDKYWPVERRLVEQRYQSLEFPMQVVDDLPEFRMQQHWSANQLLGYLASWSATQRYIAEQGHDPVAAIAEQLRSAWEGSLEKAVTWPLTLFVCRK